MSELSESSHNNRSHASSSSSTSSLRSSSASNSPNLSLKKDSKHDLPKPGFSEPSCSNPNSSQNAKSKKQKSQASQRVSKNSQIHKETKLENTQNLLTSSDSTLTNISDSYTINFLNYPDVHERVEQIRLIEENGQQVPVDSRTLEPFRSRLQSLQSSQSNNNDSHSITITTSHTTSTTSNTSTDVFNVQPENDLVGINHHSHFASSDISHREQTSGKSLLWLSVFYPSQHTMNELQTLLNIHPLTIEDCLNSEECREKNEIFENYRFLVVNELHSSSQSTELVQTTVNILVFPHIIITIHQDPVQCVDLVIKRLSKLKSGTHFTTDWVMYALLDAIVDMFFVYVNHAKREVSDIDNLVFDLSEREQSDLLRRINVACNRVFLLRSQLLRKKETVLSLLAKSKRGGAMGHQTRLYLRDVLDHILCLFDDVEMAKEQLTHLTHTYVARVSIGMARDSNQLNDIMKKFNAMATIVLPLTFVTGLWGMNVPVPGREETTLIPFLSLVGAMVALSIVAIILFRKFQYL